ncbi:phage tail tape measure protein [Bacillus cereus]|uniref:phage tail tape measure protein n=5 Tax=Bacillus cereus TaxID=1396 RepID=UPI000BEB9EF0|nr:phage tail tape measure protein [Bacillus cereus]PED30085.1 phage tail tape measure protein [Bacillus cereus]PEE50459.1 phage tail tape measure protein [Bacillus cereus]PFL88578.1 phage tail tape measure protein [Bacillus cereus]PFV65131.1 phage tail tape measure protein [Bacillus cereus]PGS31847.1 phage tail tape measure protein [Bacillus cereus]
MAGGANAGEVRARLILDNAQFRQGIQQARSEMQGLGQGATSTASSMSTLTKASAAVGTAVVAAIGASVGAAANFEQSMARVKAISNATDSEFAALSKTAKDLGASTQFSASQAAEGLSFLSMAGFKAKDSINALPSVLNLAAAGQMDLGRSADIVSNIMTGFGVSAEDTGHAVDVLTKTMTSANTDLPMLGDAMKYVAPVASSLGISMEDTATAVAKMSDAGIQGSMAGTALRAALLQLNSPTGAAQKEMEKLGLNVKDASGNMLPLPQIIGRVNEKMQGMTDSQKTAAAAHLVGTEAASGFVALLKVGEQGLADYSKGLENSAGTAERVAKIQHDTLKGAWDELTSAAEGLGITLGESLLPAFKSLVQAASGLVGGLSSLDPKLLSFSLTAAGAAAGTALLASGVMKAKTAISALGNAIIRNPATAWIAGISAAVGILTGVLASGKEEVQEYKAVSLDAYKQMGQEAKSMEELATNYEQLGKKIGMTEEQLLKYIDLQKRIKEAESPETKKQLQEELKGLTKDTKATNEEIDKYISLSGEVIKTADGTVIAYDNNGNAIAKNTDELRKLIAEKREQQRIELELQRIQAMANQGQQLSKMSEATEKYNQARSKSVELEQNLKKENAELSRQQEAYQSLLDMGDKANKKTVEYAKEKLDAQQKTTDKAREALSENRKSVAEYEKQVLEIRRAKSEMEAITNAQIDQKMQVLGITAARGQEVAEIQKTIDAENQKISQLKEQQQSHQGINDEQKQQLSDAEKRVAKLEEEKGAVQGLRDDQKQVTDEYQKQLDEVDKTKEKMKEPVETEVKVTSNTEEAKEDIGLLNQLAEAEKTKNVNADGSKAKAEISQVDADAQKEAVKSLDLSPTKANEKLLKVIVDATKNETKPLDVDPRAAMAKIQQTDKASEAQKIKPLDGNPFNLLNKIADADRKAQEPKTKPIDGNPTQANAKILDTNQKILEGKIKPINADATSAFSTLSGFNKEATAPVTKTITLRGIWEGAINKVSEWTRHNGGTVNSIRPKYHNGGIPSAQRPNRAKFDEVDVRLLKNEMVLTQAQQANLFNMIRTFNGGTATNLGKTQNSNAAGVTTISNHFEINGMQVREEADVQKIAEKLAKLQRQKQRAKGI